MKLGMTLFPKHPLNFFMSVVDRSVNERKMSADDEEVCVTSLSSLMFYSNE